MKFVDQTVQWNPPFDSFSFLFCLVESCPRKKNHRNTESSKIFFGIFDQGNLHLRVQLIYVVTSNPFVLHRDDNSQVSPNSRSEDRQTPISALVVEAVRLVPRQRGKLRRNLREQGRRKGQSKSRKNLRACQL